MTGRNPCDIVPQFSTPNGRGPVTSTIEKMLVIQDYDSRIMKLEKELADIPQRKAAIDSLLDEHRAAVAKAKDELKARQSDVKKAELDVEALREKIRKFREQQMQLKSNKEFRTMEDEILGVEKAIRQAEDRMLDMMETIEVAQGQVKAREAELKTEEESVKREIQGIEVRAGEVKAEVGKLRQERAGHAAEIDPDRLKHYERIFANKKDKALVSVDNGTCGGCYMKLPPYLWHEAKKQTSVVVCEYCGRLLYWSGRG